ncbi:MAG: MFS transporter [Woeseiaceae bacterium]
MLSPQRLKTILICLSASFVISGLLNPIGLISGPVAEWFGVPVTVAVARFGYFTVGVFCGYILSFYVYDYFKLRSVVVLGYVVIAASVASLYLFDHILVFTVCLFLIGVAASIEVCGASTLVSWLWEEKSRQSMLLAQDAMFNAGGFIFTTATTAFLTREMHWASIYLVVASIAILIAIIAATTPIEQKYQRGSDSEVVTDWSIGILVVGLSVLLFMTAKISIFIWAPQFVELEFDATVGQSGRLMQNIFVGALTGSLIGTYIVSKLRVDFFLIGMLLVGATGVWFMLSASSLETVLLLGYAVGISVGATFNGYMGFGLSLVSSPTHKNVAYVLLAGGIGSAIAPLFSSNVVEAKGTVGAALYACFIIQLLVLVSVVLLALFQKRASQKLRLFGAASNT